MKNQVTTSHENNHTKMIHPEKGMHRVKALTPGIALLGILILALSIRLIYIYQIIPTPIFHGLAMDSKQYDSFALLILKGNFTHKDFIYLNSLYPFFLALIYLICGHTHLAVVLIQALIDSLSCALVYYIATTHFNTRVGIIAALLYACYGIIIFYTGILLAPTLIIFFTLLSIASLTVAAAKRQILLFFIAGIVFGIAVLARPNLLLFLLFLPLWFLIDLKQRLGMNTSIKGFIFFIVGLFMVISLISFRNYFIIKEFTPSVLGGVNFYIGNNPEATGSFMTPYGIASSPIEEIKSSILYANKETGESFTPSQASLYWLRRGLAFIRENPLDAISLYIRKCALFWRKEEISVNITYSLSKNFAPLFLFPFISFGIIAPLALLDIIRSLRRKKYTSLLTLFILSYIISVIIFFVTARYRLPIVPFLIISSSCSIYRFAQMIQAREIKKISIVAAFLTLCVIAINKDFRYFTLAPPSRHFNNLGKVFIEEGNLDKAFVALQKALTIDPYYASAHCNLGEVYLKRGLLEKSIDEYKKALHTSPRMAEAHTLLGFAYAKKGMLDESITAHKKALAINPDLAEAYVNLGFTYVRKGRLDKAIDEFKKALVIKPHCAEAYNNLASAHLKEGRLDEAIADYKRALTFKPNYVQAHKNLGFAYYKKGDLDNAISKYTDALAIDPRYAKAHYHLGIAYSKKGSLDNAIFHFKKALAIAPNDAITHYNLASTYDAKGEHALAKRHYDKVKELGY